MSITIWPLIDVDDAGMAVVSGTTTKVIEIALDRLTHHWDVDEILRQHPHLSLSQIHAALGYYHDHQAECDKLIHDRLVDGNQLSEAMLNPVLQNKLRERAAI